jgi:ATP-dependent helicase/nuclease subunit B
MYSWLKQAVRPNAVVITASRRLARQLQSEYADIERLAGRLAWPTPGIFSFEDWCKKQLETSVDPASTPTIIDRFSSAILWERDVREQVPDELLSLSGMVRQVRETWRKVEDWRVPVTDLKDSARSEDERLFATTAMSYRRRLTTNGWVDGEGIPAWVSGMMGEGRIMVPDAVMLAGFDRYSPAVTAVLDAMKDRGCKVSHAPLPDIAGDMQIACCADSDAELRSAGGWARDILQRSPSARIGIVVPTLQADADRATRQVREGLAPGWQYAGPRWRASVNVSYGRKLSAYPAIATALLLLRWVQQGLTVADISLLLRSSSIANQQLGGRSRLELKLRQHADRAWTPEGLLALQAEFHETLGSVEWTRGLETSVALRTDTLAEASPADWARRIDQFLTDWNWPGDRALTSEEFQLVNRWRDLLNELAATTAVTPRIRFAEALHRLANRAAEVVFQSEGNVGVVSLLGTLEAAGMQFDHLWVCDMHAGQWPASGSPSALLSRQLQKAYAMPDATPADTLEYSRRILNRLAHSAPSVIFSWPTHDGESEMAPTSLLDELDCRDYSGVVDPQWHAEEFCGADSLTVIHDDQVPPVGSKELVRGGAYTVQRQSEEPFGAFVTGRLGVRQLDAIQSGISAALRGNIIHGALYQLFSHGPSQADLRDWDDTSITQRLGSAIDTVLAEHLRHADTTMTRLLGLERTRLFRLLRDFLALEKERESFEIEQVEESVAYQQCGVRLDLRVDRIDRLPDGSLLVLDYKTGAPKNFLNKDGEPRDLQLVVYADALDTTIGGLALINLDRREISYKGTGGSVEWDAARKEQWPERIAAWRRAVHLSLQEIAAGDVRINLHLSADQARPFSILSRVEEYKRGH